MADDTAYDRGYASIVEGHRVSGELSGQTNQPPAWGPATIRLHLGRLAEQLRREPQDEFRWGRCDALCDLLLAADPKAAEGALPRRG